MSDIDAGAKKPDWWIFKGDGKQKEGIELPTPPGWRIPGFNREYEDDKLPESGATNEKKGGRGANYIASDAERQMVNAALWLRRPLLVTGAPGVGKSSLAYAVAWELNLGPVLKWPITTRSTLLEGLYRYDAIARLQDSSLFKNGRAKATNPEAGKSPHANIGQYIRLGPLGTAMASTGKPRVLLIDELDKSDIDLPNDLLNVLEDGEFEIPELSRLDKYAQTVEVLPFDRRKETPKVKIVDGIVRSQTFPLIIMTSNGEKEFPPAFLRRCLRLYIPPPDEKKLAEIVKLHFKGDTSQLGDINKHIAEFVKLRGTNNLATDQLLNALFLVRGITDDKEQQAIKKSILQNLNNQAET